MKIIRFKYWTNINTCRHLMCSVDALSHTNAFSLMGVINSNKTTKIHLSVCVNEKEKERIMLIRKLMITMWKIKGQVMIIWINYCLGMFSWRERRNDAHTMNLWLCERWGEFFFIIWLNVINDKKKCISCSVPYEVVILINRRRGLWILHVSDRCLSPSFHSIFKFIIFSQEEW